jgi:neutral ceramidase
MVEVGFARVDITPAIGSPLSGFVARQNRPSTSVDAPLMLRSLALRDQDRLYFLLSYDLLGIPASIEKVILERLERGLNSFFDRSRCVLVATHNHSGPSLGLLGGEPGPDPAYVGLLADRALEAASSAIERLEPAQMFAAERRLPGLTYNRRALLPDGRVSISPVIDQPVIKRGPLDDRAAVILWRSLNGENLAGLIHFACHGVAVLSQAIGPDIPGELAERMSILLGAPCLFLQGAAGDVNPTTVTATRNELLDWVERAAGRFHGIQEDLLPVDLSGIHTINARLPLHYSPLPGWQRVERDLRSLERIAQGDVSSPDLEDALRAFKNTMNLPAAEPLDPALARDVALPLIESSRRTLAALRSGLPLQAQSMQISIWRLGGTTLVFLAGEIFTTTGARIRALCENRILLPVSCLAPLLGYIPDLDALQQGGYEVNDAWRFYGHPAPFAPESEQCVVDKVGNLLVRLRD